MRIVLALLILAACPSAAFSWAGQNCRIIAPTDPTYGAMAIEVQTAIPKAEAFVICAASWAPDVPIPLIFSKMPPINDVARYVVTTPFALRDSFPTSATIRKFTTGDDIEADFAFSIFCLRPDDCNGPLDDGFVQDIAANSQNHPTDPKNYRLIVDAWRKADIKVALSAFDGVETTDLLRLRKLYDLGGALVPIDLFAEFSNNRLTKLGVNAYATKGTSVGKTWDLQFEMSPDGLRLLSASLTPDF